MSPWEVEGDGFVIGIKPVGPKGGAGSFKDIKGFPSCFDFVIAFPMDKELAFLSIDSIFEDLFNFPFLLSRGIDRDGLFGGRFRETWEGFEVWSEVDSKMAAVYPRVDALHDGREVKFVVIVIVRSFADRKGTKP